MFEVTCFSETLAASRELLEAGGPLLIEVDAKLEEDQLRMTCQRIASLDQEASKAAAGIRVIISDDSSLKQLSELVNGEPRGRNMIRIVARTGNREVELGLKSTVTLTPKFMGTLRGIAGIAEVEEI